MFSIAAIFFARKQMRVEAHRRRKIMPKAKRFSMEQIPAVQKMLRNLPSKKIGKTGAEAVECLAESIRKAVKKGQSLKEIQGILVGEGIQVSLSRMEALMKAEKDAVQKKGDGSAPGHAEWIDCWLFTIPGKREGE
jgi:hypothetical protein